MCSIFTVTSSSIDQETLQRCFERTISRGPDASRLEEVGSGWMGFHRLSIMELSSEGMQPFERNGNVLICNGEIYGFRKIKQELEQKGYTFAGDCDCEILLPLYERCGTEMFAMLGSEFALVLYDAAKGQFLAARDPIGIRPLYYGYDESGAIAFASEPKMLLGLCEKIRPFPPGHYYEEGRFIRYADDLGVEISSETDLEIICRGIRDRLTASVEARLDADAPIGFLLSGGLDSSLVCALASRILGKPIRTFAIGMDTDPIDLKYAKSTAEFIGSRHTSYTMTKDEVLAALPEVVALLGTWDITTIRASIGMYLCCRRIHQDTDIKVLMTGEISDELFGYKYTDYAPDAAAFQQEAEKRIRELHMYDVLRADRCISVNSLEARVPFGDREFVRYVMAIRPSLKMNRYHMGKYLLRHAFEGEGLLPDAILWRQKAAFSDAVGHSMVDVLKACAEERYSDSAFAAGCSRYSYCPPFSKESLLYRDLFEEVYPGQAEMIADYWMPNRDWPGCRVDDPSARVLANYGASGQ